MDVSLSSRLCFHETKGTQFEYWDLHRTTIFNILRSGSSTSLPASFLITVMPKIVKTNRAARRINKPRLLSRRGSSELRASKIKNVSRISVQLTCMLL